jgi:hypothetical protein
MQRGDTQSTTHMMMSLHDIGYNECIDDILKGERIMSGVLGVAITREEYDEYLKLKKKNKQMKKESYRGLKHCPACWYVVDYGVPTQQYCDRCGQRLKD